MVRSVASELRRLGYQTWLDVECLRPGERWRTAIERAMADSKAMVYCVSRLSVESAWTSVELNAARERGLPIVPLLIDDLPIEELPPALRELQLICAAEWPTVDAPARAARAIARSVGRPVDGPFVEPGNKEAALRVEVERHASGNVTLSWVNELFRSPVAPLDAQSLAELARVSEGAHRVELGIGDHVDASVAALVLGTLVGRVGPARVCLAASPSVMQALATALRSLQPARADAEAGVRYPHPEDATSGCAEAHR